MEDKIISYGGQAVIEGVMMRGQKAFAIAMRAPDGNIVIHKENTRGGLSFAYYKNPISARRDLALGCAGVGHARADPFCEHPNG